jgi:predicted nucleic-acid-binding protein
MIGLNTNVLVRLVVGDDFVDALIGHINRSRGCEATATFDQKAAKLDEFVILA